MSDILTDNSNLNDTIAADTYQITDAPLPLSQNYSQLKTAGLDYIKALASSQWNNYNDSDPGITILDQLCYALTECR